MNLSSFSSCDIDYDDDDEGDDEPLEKLSKPWQYGLMKLSSMSLSIDSKIGTPIILVSLLVITPQTRISRSMSAAVNACGSSIDFERPLLVNIIFSLSFSWYNSFSFTLSDPVRLFISYIILSFSKLNCTTSHFVLYRLIWGIDSSKLLKSHCSPLQTRSKCCKSSILWVHLSDTIMFLAICSLSLWLSVDNSPMFFHSILIHPQCFSMQDNRDIHFNNLIHWKQCLWGRRIEA